MLAVGAATIRAVGLGSGVALSLLVGSFVVLAFARGPVWAIGILIVFIPINTIARYFLPPDSTAATILYMGWKEGLVGIALAAGVWRVVVVRSHAARLGGSEVTALLLLGTGVVYLLKADYLALGVVGFSEMLTGVVLFLAVRLAPLSPEERSALVRVMIVSLVVLCAGGLVIYFAAPEPRFWEWVGVPAERLSNSWREILGTSVPRLSSFLLHPLEMGYVAMILCTICLATYVVRRRVTAVLLVAMSLGAAALLFTFTRSAMLGLLAGLLVFASVMRLPKSLVYGVVIVAGLVLATDVFGAFFRSSARLEEASAASHYQEFFVLSPEWLSANLWGHGLGMTGETVERLTGLAIDRSGIQEEGIEGEYFKIVGNIGVVGLGIYIAFVGTCVRGLYRLLRWPRWPPWERTLLLAALGVVVGIHVGVTVLPVLTLRTLNFYMWILCGLALGLVGGPRTGVPRPAG